MTDEAVSMPKILPSLDRATRSLAKSINKNPTKTPELEYVQGQVTSVSIKTTTLGNTFLVDVDIDGTTVYAVTCLNCFPKVNDYVWLAYLGAGRYLCIGSSGLGITSTAPRYAALQGSSTRASAAYGDLVAGAGPSVQLYTGSAVKVTLTAGINNSGGTAQTFMSYTITGATSFGASDQTALGQQGPAGDIVQASFVHIATGLTPGLNTFTCKYRAVTGTITAIYRTIIVEPCS